MIMPNGDIEVVSSNLVDELLFLKISCSRIFEEINYLEIEDFSLNFAVLC